MIALFVAVLLASASAPAAAASVGAASAATASPPVVTWQGITLGEPISAVLARLGTPDTRRRAVMGSTLYEFRALEGDGTLSLTENAGIVIAVRVTVANPADLHSPVIDPFGVALGDTADRLTELRGVPQRYDDEGGGEFTSYYGMPSDARWAYGLHDDVVRSIAVIQPYRIVRATGVAVAVPTPRPSGAPTPPPPDASSLDRAIKVTPDDLDADMQFEYTYVRAVPCGTGDSFSPTGETLINAKRRNYSRIDATCRSTGEQRSFYFDITAVFGRADR
jgi:hypothetical protein